MRPFYKSPRWRASLPTYRLDMTEKYFDSTTHDIAQDAEICRRCGERVRDIIERGLDCKVRAHVDIEGRRTRVPT